MLLLTNKTIDKLKHDLVREGLVDIDGLTLAENSALSSGTNLATELVKANIISETKLLNFVEDKLHIPFVELEDYTPDIECLNFISGEQALKYNIFPLFKIEDVLTIAMSDPLDLFTINTLFEDKSLLIEPVVCSEASIKKVIDTYYFNKNFDGGSVNWQEKFITDNLSDDLLREAIRDIINDAIYSDCEHIFMEYFHSGLNIYFEKELKGYVPNILVPRFIYEFKALAKFDSELNEFAQNSKFTYNFENKQYSVLASIFPASFGNRITISIYKPLKSLSEFNITENKIQEIFSSNAFIGIDFDKYDNGFLYSLAEYIGRTKSVLIVENTSLYNLQNVCQVEFKQNTGVYFDEILNQVEMQKFDVVFWEKIYEKEQAEKLRLLSNEVIIATSSNNNFIECFDEVLN